MDPEIKHHLTTGREFYRAGEYARARPHLEAVRSAHDEFADVHNMLGFIHYEQGEPDQAREAFERALAINPHYTEASLNLSVVYNELGRYDEGRRMYEQAHNARGGGGLENLEPLARGKIANMHRDLADAYAAVGLPDHAIKELRKALRICPTFVDIRTKLANTLSDLSRYSEAIDEFVAVCDLSPDYIPARTHFGVTLWRTGDVQQARAQWQEVMARDPDNRSCQVYLKMTEPLANKADGTVETRHKSVSGLQPSPAPPPPRVEDDDTAPLDPPPAALAPAPEGGDPNPSDEGSSDADASETSAE